VPSPPL